MFVRPICLTSYASFGQVTDGFWEWLETKDSEVLGKLHAIKARFDELHIDFVPSLGCGSGGQENGGTTATIILP